MADAVADSCQRLGLRPGANSADQLADAVFTELCATLATLGALPVRASDAPWEEALRHALLDERLYGIEARFGFELRVAILLVQGWRPGHQVLLLAASAVFGWTRGAALASLGATGAILDRALEEHALYDTQSMSTRDAQRRVLRLLRERRPSDSQIFTSYFVHFRVLEARFPHWLAIVAPMDRIAYWRDRCPAPDMPFDPPLEQIAWRPGLMAAGICLYVVFKLDSILTLAQLLAP